MKQSEVFMRSEGDAWFRRNHQALQSRVLPQDDPLLSALVTLPELQPGSAPLRILEVGCGEGVRLGWLQGNRVVDVVHELVAHAGELWVPVEQSPVVHLVAEHACLMRITPGARFCTVKIQDP